MTYTDEKLSAFIDGELPRDELENVARAIESDSALAARVAQLKAPNALILDAYSGIDDEPMPDSIMALLSDAPEKGVGSFGENVIQFAAKPTAPAARPWLAPLAASIALAIGVGVGMQIADNARAPLSIASLISPGHPLYAAIEGTPSGSTISTAVGDVTPVLTFVSTEDQYCREYSIRGDAEASRAVACKNIDGWQIEFAMFGVSSNGGTKEYSTASSIDESRFANFVSDLMADDALSREDEAALLDRWER